MIIDVRGKKVGIEVGPFQVSDFPTQTAQIGDGWIVRVFDPEKEEDVTGTYVGLVYETEEEAEKAAEVLAVAIGLGPKAIMTAVV